MGTDCLLSQNLLTESKQRLLRRMPGLRNLVSASRRYSAKEVACIEKTMSFFHPIIPYLISRREEHEE
jgi:hypothetical protein